MTVMMTDPVERSGSALYKNAVDSLRIGLEFFLAKKDYSGRKHAILTLVHAIELFLKERLRRTNPLLIYRNIDALVTEDSLTVGVRDALVRLENLGLGLPKREKVVIEKIQQRRNRIEHHRYDHVQDDEIIIAESLRFILFFVDEQLGVKLDSDVPPELLRAAQRTVFEHNELYWLGHHRLEAWLKERWPDWSPEVIDSPDDFAGTLTCPECRQDFLVMELTPSPFCFLCNTTIDAVECEHCGRVRLASDSPCGCS